QSLDLFAIASLDFERPDEETFPCLRLAREAFKTGGTMPAVLNAANEIAVAAFLLEQIRISDIPLLISDVMAEHQVSLVESLEEVLRADDWARAQGQRWVSQYISATGTAL